VVKLLLLSLTLSRKRCLAAAKPQTEHTPSASQRRGNKGDAGEPKPEPRQQRIRPGANLVSRAIHERVHKALRFMFVLASQDGEENFAGGSFEFAKPPRQKLAQIMNLIALALLIAFAVVLALSQLWR
jgi:hypothetical protein